jgi:hypothetical protein
MDFSHLQRERESKAKKDIQDHLDKEMDKLVTSKWSEAVGSDLPEFLLSDFQNAVMNNNPKDVQVLSHILFAIGKKKLDDLTFADVGITVNLLGNATPATWNESFDAYVEKRRRLDILTTEYNTAFKKKESELIKSRQFMLGMYNQKTWEKINTSKFIN